MSAPSALETELERCYFHNRPSLDIEMYLEAARDLLTNNFPYAIDTDERDEESGEETDSAAIKERKKAYKALIAILKPFIPKKDGMFAIQQKMIQLASARNFAIPADHRIARTTVTLPR